MAQPFFRETNYFVRLLDFAGTLITATVQLALWASIPIYLSMCVLLFVVKVVLADLPFLVRHKCPSKVVELFGFAFGGEFFLAGHFGNDFGQ